MPTERNACHGVERKGGGMFKISGRKLYSVTSLRYVLVKTTECMCGEKPEKVGGPTLYRDKMAENSASWFGGA